MTERAAAAPGNRSPARGRVIVEAMLGDHVGEGTAGLRTRYVDGLGFIARAFDAEVRWVGDKAVFFVNGDTPSHIPANTFAVAREVSLRVALDLGLQARVWADLLQDPRDDDLVSSPPFSPAPSDGAPIVSEPLAFMLSSAMREQLSRSARPKRLGTWDRVQSLALRPEVRTLRYVGLRLGKKVPPVLALRDVFVEPLARVVPKRVHARETIGEGTMSRGRPAEPLDEAAVQFIDLQLTGLESRPHADEVEPQAVSKLLAKCRRVVLLGEPGGGKTTLLRWLALETASGRWPDLTGRVEPMLPVLVSAGHLATLAAEVNADPSAVLARYLAPQASEPETTLAAFLSENLTKGRVLLLVDGLDETRTEERPAIEKWLAALVARHPTTPLVVTSRFVGYAGLSLPAPTVEAHLQPFSAEACEKFVRGFSRAYVAWEHATPSGAERVDPRPLDEVAAHEANGLLEALAASERLTALGSNPFLLSALALIHRAEGRLPRHRAQAYETMTRALCETWEQARRLVATPSASPAIAYEEEALPVLGDLAVAMHEEYPTGVAPTAFVEKRLARSLSERRGVAKDIALSAAREFLRRASEEAPILTERGPGLWGFAHLTFQEFFVAAGLHADERFEEVALAHLVESRWEEILRLGVGYMALVQKRPRATARFIEAALAWKAPEPWTEAVELTGKPIAIAALLAAEAGDALPEELQQRIAEGFVAWLARLQALLTVDHWGARWLHGMAPMEEWAVRLAGVLWRSLHCANENERATWARAAEILGVAWTPAQMAEVVPEAHDRSVPAFATLLARVASPEDLDRLLHDRRVGARAAVIIAAGLHTDSITRDLLVRALRDEHPQVRMAAIHGLGERHETDEPIQMAVLNALPSLPLEPAIGWYFERVRVSPAVFSALVKQARSETDPDLLQWRLSMLAVANHPDAPGIALSLAAERWASFGPKDVLCDFADSIVRHRQGALLETGLRSSNRAMRTLCGLLLAHVLSPFEEYEKDALPAGLDGLLGEAVKLAHDPDSRIRECLFVRLNPERGTEVREALIAGCGDPETAVRRAAYASLAQAPLRDTISVLRGGLRDPDPEVRCVSLAVLPHLPPSQQATTVKSALADAEPEVRLAVLAHLEPEAPLSLKTVSMLASDPALHVRRELAWWLHLHGSKSHLLALDRLLLDPDHVVQRWALAALSELDDGTILRFVRPARRSPDLVRDIWHFLELRHWILPAAPVPARRKRSLRAPKHTR